MGWRGGNACIYERTFALTCGGVVEPLLDAVADRLRLERSEVLDVGSGTGRLAAAAARRGAVVTAVDPDPAMIREAQRLRPDAAPRWLVAGAPTLPFPDGDFDVVTLAFILNHVPSPESTLRHCARALRPGGVLAIAVWGDSGLVEAWDAVLGVPGAVRRPPRSCRRRRTSPAPPKGSPSCAGAQA